MTTQTDEIQIQIAEFEKLRDEILQTMNIEQQTIVLALGSASIAIPLLLDQIKNVPISIVASLLYTLTIVYSVMVLNLITSNFMLNILGDYINSYIEPEINRLINKNLDHRVLQWEFFLRNERKKAVPFILSSLSSIGIVIMIMLPSAASLLSANYIQLIPSTISTEQNVASMFFSSLLPVLTFIAWFFFIGTLICILLHLLYTNFEIKWFGKIKKRRIVAN